MARAASGGGEPACRRPLVVVWSEGTAPKEIYPGGINGAVAAGLLVDLPGWEVVSCGQDDPDQGLPDHVLERTRVLVWWGHERHDSVDDGLVSRIVRRVREDGMGFIALHSSHFAKANRQLMGTPCSWRAYLHDSVTLTVTVADPMHPIAAGVHDFVIDHHERYSAPYAVPEPGAVVFEGVASLKDGGRDASQQGLCWTVGKGRLFYFQPGHETSPVFTDENVRRVVANAVRWAAAR